jgi:restriction endonuclease S subunit
MYIIVAIHSLVEQERIVKRAEQLLSLCDALEAQLRVSENERGRLVKSVLAGVAANSLIGKDGVTL